MIAVIDMGMGNVNSVERAVRRSGGRCSVTKDPDDIRKADMLILPGVGSFSKASGILYSTGMAEAVLEGAVSGGKPVLGICLGMQLLAASGEEGGDCRGLGLIKARVVKMSVPERGFRLPHVGWNDVDSRGMRLFSGIPENSCFYFVHSYELVLEEETDFCTCNYGTDFVAAVKRGNVIGTQFHPEKSQMPGLRLLENFIKGVY